MHEKSPRLPVRQLLILCKIIKLEICMLLQTDFLNQQYVDLPSQVRPSSLMSATLGYKSLNLDRFRTSTCTELFPLAKQLFSLPPYHISYATSPSDESPQPS